MPNIKASIKDLRKTGRKSTYNDRLRNRIKRAVKSFSDLLKQNNPEKAAKLLPNINKVLDKAAKKNVIKKENASRKISRLTKNLNKITANNVKDTKKSS
ncbi:MAG TPA: 30S ribosomal protein S20 [Candidatus Dojkabacteria bacterium]|nr:30S ribosomal protein S20 [Candidatus Dojkabacteria bacterium]